MYPTGVPRCASVSSIHHQPAPHSASAFGDIAETALAGLPQPAPRPLSLTEAAAASDTLWSLALPIGIAVLFVVVVVAGVFVLRAVITRRNPDIKEP